MTTTHSIPVDTVLFDMDGTLIDSTPALVAAWKEFSDEYNLDYEHVINTCHGHRATENMRRFIPSLTDEQVEAEALRFENRIIELSNEARRTGDKASQITAIPGAANLLREIQAGPSVHDAVDAATTATGAHTSTTQPWAIVTSATADYAAQVFANADVSSHAPDTFVAADHVSRGKPDPQPYMLGAQLAGTDARRCIVVEDAPAGAVAGKRAGAQVIGLRTTHDEAERLWEADADYVVKDLTKVHARWEGQQLMIDVQSEAKPMPVAAAL